jgi:hypothetical protein
MGFSLRTLKRGLIFFWALWLSIVFATNAFDFLKHVGGLGESWAFASGNYDFMMSKTALYSLPDGLVMLLFLGVLVWEGLAAALLWRAFAAYRGGGRGLNAVHTAFAFSLALWAAFMIADELLIAYDVEGTHMGIFTAQLVTLVAVRLLPEDGN